MLQRSEAVETYEAHKPGPAVREMACLLRQPPPHYGYNLSRLWRIADRIHGAAPLFWARQAGHLLCSFSQYVTDLDPSLWVPGPEDRADTLWCQTDGVLDSIEAEFESKEDVTTLHAPVALAYACYVDAKLAAHVARVRAAFEDEEDQG